MPTLGKPIASIVSAGISKFGVREGLYTRELFAEAAREALQRLAERLEIQDAEQRVEVAASTKEGILETARELGADLIVVGSHGRHGLALLLGSTANAVLHGAPCDVLAVRIHA